MTEDTNNPIDDELLKELGLEPGPKPVAKPIPKTSAKGQTPTATAVASKAGVSASAPPKPEVPKTTSSEQFSKGVEQITQNMPVQVVAVLGKKTLSLKEVLAIKQGEILEFQKKTHELIDLVANGKLVARGELVVIEDQLGIQIKQLIG